MIKKLSVDDKTAILSSPASSRELGKKYGVHHSVINDLRKEAKDIMKAHWEAKSQRRGRPKNETPDPLIVQENNFERERYGHKIKSEWLELQLKHALDERDYAQKLIKSQQGLKKKS